MLLSRGDIRMVLCFAKILLATVCPTIPLEQLEEWIIGKGQSGFMDTS